MDLIKNWVNQLLLWRNEKPVGQSQVVLPNANVRRIVYVGNCQVNMLSALSNAMQNEVHATGWEMTPDFINALEDTSCHDDRWDGVECIWTHPNAQWQVWLQKQPAHFQERVRPLPTIDTLGFHPDCAYVHVKGRAINSPIGAYHSALVLWGFLQGLSTEETRALFTEQVFRQLGFMELQAVGIDHLVNKGRQCGMPIHRWLADWQDAGVWMHSINHPKPRVLADVALHCLSQLGISGVADAHEVVVDELARSPCWPVYPELAQALGLSHQGSYAFKAAHRSDEGGRSVQYMGLQAFIEASYVQYARYAPHDLQCERLHTQAFHGLKQFLAHQAAHDSATSASLTGNPYLDLPDTQFWRRSVERVPASELDPVQLPPFRITSTDKVATAGSCFAQHIARTLTSNGFHYLVTERADHLTVEQQFSRNYGMFSARFGYVYTARQLLQLLEMALGISDPPMGLVWQREDGRWIDGLRPYIEPDGFENEAQALASRQQMLICASDMFQGCDVFIFTMGLTEAWQRLADGVVLPIAPGAAARAAPMNEFGFINFKHNEVLADMRSFLWLLKSVNPRVRLVLTVSPVPLVATYEPHSVMSSTAYSKAVLRSVAEELSRAFDWVAYFASYEVITAAPNAGNYFASDWRSVTPEGVTHVMRLFMQHFTNESNFSDGSLERSVANANKAELHSAIERVGNVICDEEQLDGGRA